MNKLILNLAFGLFAFSYVFLDDENLKIISFVGGISIIGFASTQIFNVTKGKVDHKLAYGGVSNKKAPILLGAMFSAFSNLVVHDRLKVNF
jgi:hypothetical protein